MSNLSEGASHESCVWSSSLRFSMESVSMLLLCWVMMMIFWRWAWPLENTQHLVDSFQFHKLSSFLVVGCCSHPRLERFIRWLIKSRANVSQMVNIEDSRHVRGTRKFSPSTFSLSLLSLAHPSRTRSRVHHWYPSSRRICAMGSNYIANQWRSVRLWSVRKSYRKPINYKFKVF